MLARILGSSPAKEKQRGGIRANQWFQREFDTGAVYGCKDFWHVIH